MSALVMCCSGAWIVKPPPSTPALVARFASRSNARDELGPAVGIARIIERVDADEDVARAARLGQAEREARKIVLRAGT